MFLIGRSENQITPMVPSTEYRAIGTSKLG